VPSKLYFISFKFGSVILTLTVNDVDRVSALLLGVGSTKSIKGMADTKDEKIRALKIIKT